MGIISSKLKDGIFFSYGFYCDNKNNEVIGKQCSDYKIRLCCKKESPAQWGKWSEWTECSKSCGSGTKKRDRVCVMKKGEKEGCFNDGPHGEKRFREMEIACNELPCPRKFEIRQSLRNLLFALSIHAH